MIPRASFEGSTRILKYELEEREDVTYTVCEYFATLIDQVDNYFLKALLSEQTFLKLHNKFMIGLTSINKEIDEERMRRRTLPEFSSKHQDVLQRQFGPSKAPRLGLSTFNESELPGRANEAPAQATFEVNSMESSIINIPGPAGNSQMEQPSFLQEEEDEG